MSNGDIQNFVTIAAVPTNERLQHIEKLFNNEFKTKPDFFVRVPGRVNLIGEHIDYCGYPVLPMALEQDIMMAVKRADEPILVLRNVNDKYKSFDCVLSDGETIEMHYEENGKPCWFNYVLCGIKGALEFVCNKYNNGVQIYVDGNIPPASGLSSSSALVSASCLAFLHAQGIVPEKSEIASLCARSERYVGTQGGGMDQAIAFLAQKGCAQYITWQPLCARPVSLPENATFVVAHSLAEANKAATNDFNQRVIECRLATKLLARLCGVPDYMSVQNLAELQTLLNKNLKDMPESVLKFLPKNKYTKTEICDLLNVREQELNDSVLTPNTIHFTEFKLQQRALHVYEEAYRVEKFREICELADNIKSRDKVNGASRDNVFENGDVIVRECTIKKLGNLMSESHDSLKKLYECSHENLDKLVDISETMDVNSRLTGAGWGGCIVALCPQDKVGTYMETLKKCFYKEHLKDKDLNGHVFATTPNYGAIIYKNSIS